MSLTAVPFVCLQTCLLRPAVRADAGEDHRVHSDPQFRLGA